MRGSSGVRLFYLLIKIAIRWPGVVTFVTACGHDFWVGSPVSETLGNARIQNIIRKEPTKEKGVSRCLGGGVGLGSLLL